MLPRPPEDTGQSAPPAALPDLASRTAAAAAAPDGRTHAALSDGGGGSGPAANYWLRRHRHHDWSLIDDLPAVIADMRPDAVVCTGDHSSISEPREFKQAMAAWIQ